MQRVIMLTKKDARLITGGLSETSKMPSKSYGLPTHACITGSRLAEVDGTICSTCYANKGHYKMYAKNIVPAQERRLDSIYDPDWVEAMATLIGDDQYFRWHDSGDLQSVNHLHNICLVCNATPNTKHWLPTREIGIVKEYLREFDVPTNLVIRISAFKVDEPAKSVWELPTSTVHADKKPIGRVCKAPDQDGHCGKCRACWDPKVKNVSYRAH